MKKNSQKMTIFFLYIFNKLIKLRNQVKESWSTIDILLKKRTDLIPNIVEVVKGYSKYEKKTITEIIKARSNVLNATSKEESIKNNEALSKSIDKILLLKEEYPELKADKNYMSLQNKLSDLEDNVSEDKEYCIPGEFIANGYTKNTLKHEKGVISMARSDYSQTDASLVDEGYNSAGSQFFIMTENNTSLDGLYAAFGRVIEGMDIVEKIENVKVTYRSSDLKEGQEAPKDKDGNKLDADRPINPPVIKSLRVETYGIDYGVPETNDVFDYYTWLMNTYYGQGA